MSRRRPARERHLRVVEPEPVRELVSADVPKPSPIEIDTSTPDLNPWFYLRHRTYDEDTIAFAARFGIELRFAEPFPCRGYQWCCDCFRCQRRQQWTVATREALLAGCVKEPRASYIAATTAEERARTLLKAPGMLPATRSTRRRRRRRAA